MKVFHWSAVLILTVSIQCAFLRDSLYGYFSKPPSTPPKEEEIIESSAINIANYQIVDNYYQYAQFKDESFHLGQIDSSDYGISTIFSDNDVKVIKSKNDGFAFAMLTTAEGEQAMLQVGGIFEHVFVIRKEKGMNVLKDLSPCNNFFPEGIDVTVKTVGKELKHFCLNVLPDDQLLIAFKKKSSGYYFENYSPPQTDSGNNTPLDTINDDLPEINDFSLEAELDLSIYGSISVNENNNINNEYPVGVLVSSPNKLDRFCITRLVSEGRENMIELMNRELTDLEVISLPLTHSIRPITFTTPTLTMGIPQFKSGHFECIFATHHLVRLAIPHYPRYHISFRLRENDELSIHNKIIGSSVYLARLGLLQSINNVILTDICVNDVILVAAGHRNDAELMTTVQFLNKNVKKISFNSEDHVLSELVPPNVVGIIIRQNRFQY